MYTTVPANDEAVVRLGNLLYHRALVRRDQERITDPKGQPIGWLLDTRTAMLDGELFGRVGAYLANRLEARELHQVAGYGFGAYPMVCAVVSAAEGRPFRGGFVREYPKPYGRHRLVEGPVDRSKPIVMVDDILNSGRSAGKALALLRNDGFTVSGMLTLFNFAWSQGKRRLEGEGLWVEALVDLNLRGNPGDSMSSDSAG